MRVLSALVLTAALLGVPAAAAASETASASVVVAATFSTRTSLTVSSDELRFDVTTASQPAVASVEFSAGARTVSSAQVVLSVEPLAEVEGPRGNAQPDCALSFTGQGNGSVGGGVALKGSTVAGRWTGSGLRQGRLVFALRADAPGSYTVPVRFVLTAP
jgi:hypothetical protein